MRLVATSAGQTLSFPLRQGSTLIGRHSSCHVCIPASTISRRHCQCYVDGTNVTLRDLDSSHGTFVNGRRVERADLRHGDVISLGGFELRFDSEGAAPTYAHGAGAAQDIVVTAEPSGAETAAGPPPGAQGSTQAIADDLPPLAPTDAPESPSGDETPADQSFVPVAYTPQRETVLGGGANQPQLVVREGRWFLRDPRTGREIEIAPAGGAAAAAAPAAAIRRPNVRLLVTVVAIAAILVITFAIAILRPPKTNVDIAKIGDRAWAEIVDGGLDALRKGDYDKALAQFKLAVSKRPELEPAKHLTQYALLRQAAGDVFLKLDRNEAKRYLESIENTRCPSDRAIAFAREQRVWIDKESVAHSEYEAAKAKADNAGENEELLLEARNDLQRVPPERYAARLAKQEIANIHKTISTNRLRRGDREKAQAEWAKAITEYQAAVPFVEDDALKVRIKKDVEDCRRYALEDGYIRQAQDAIAHQNLDEAERLLKLVKAGYYYERAQRMLASIKSMRAAGDLKRRREEVPSLYESGAPPEAIEEAIKRNKLEGEPQFRQMVDRARRIQTLLDAGKKAEDEEQWREAEDKYLEAVGVETDTKNEYNRSAQRLLDAIKARYPEIAAKLASRVFPLVNKDPLQARKWAEEALKYDANNKRAKDGLDHLERQAKLLLNEGMRDAAEKKFHTARIKLKKALDSAAPGSTLYQRIAQEYQKVLDQLGE